MRSPLRWPRDEAAKQVLVQLAGTEAVEMAAVR